MELNWDTLTLGEWVGIGLIVITIVGAAELFMALRRKKDE